MSDQYVADDERDAILDRLLTIPDNKVSLNAPQLWQVCFDCKSKNPKWASSNIGIFLCYQCTSAHRNFGVHISFVRSLKMDRWKLKELKQMELGGNKNAQIYFEKNGMYTDNKPNHKAVQLTKYKADLLKRVEHEIGSVQHQGSAVFVPPQADAKNTFKAASNIDFENPQLIVSKSISLEETKGQAPLPLKAQKNSIQLQSTSGQFGSQNSGLGLGFGKQPVNQEVKTLNAKKLDVNFDNDDFFNSFEPQQLSKDPSFGAKDTNSKFVTSKLQEVKDDEPPVQNSQFTMNKQLSFGAAGGVTGGASNASDELEAQQRLKALGNKKGISSEDLFGKQEQKTQEVVERYQQLSGARAISSDMFFGQNTEPKKQGNIGEEMEGYMMGRSSQNSNNSYDEYKEQAAKMAERVQEGAKVLKEKALDWLSTFTS